MAKSSGKRSPIRFLIFIPAIALLVTSCSHRRESDSQNSPPPPIETTANTTSAVQVTGENYDEVVRSQKVVLILFWAEWSAPDRAIAPVIDAVAKDYSGRVKSVKVNVDDNPELAGKFNIRGIPTVVVLKDGKEQERVVGLAPKQKFIDLLEKQLH